MNDAGAIHLSDPERRYMIDRVAEIIARDYMADLDLLYPEMVAALCKCDVRTLESRGLPRVEIGPRNIRYRRSDVEALIRRSFSPAPNTRRTNTHEQQHQKSVPPGAAR